MLLSKSTYDRLTDRNLPLDAMEPRHVKGKAEPLHVYRLFWEHLG